MTYQYITNCVNSTAENIDEMVDNAKELTYKTFIKYVNWKDASRLLNYDTHYKRGLLLKNDWAVSYHKSTYIGLPCFYVRWSAIEWIFIKSTEGS